MNSPKLRSGVQEDPKMLVPRRLHRLLCRADGEVLGVSRGAEKQPLPRPREAWVLRPAEELAIKSKEVGSRRALNLVRSHRDRDMREAMIHQAP